MIKIIIQNILRHLPPFMGGLRGAAFSVLCSVFCVLCSVFCISCEETVYRSSVPTYPVEMRLNIAGEYVHFVPDNTGQYLTFTKPRFPNEAIGFAGILVCTGYDRAYYAYDLACPGCLSQSKHLEVDGMFAVCPVCTEAYEFYNGLGNPTKGIVRENLRRYQTTISGNYLHIHH